MTMEPFHDEELEDSDLGYFAMKVPLPYDAHTLTHDAYTLLPA